MFFFEKSKDSHNNNLNYIGIKSQLDCENSCLNNVECKNYSLYYPKNVQNINYDNKYDCYLSNNKKLDGNFTNLINDKDYRGRFDKIDKFDIEIIKKNYKNNLLIHDDYELLHNNNLVYYNNTICRSQHQVENNNISKYAISKGYKTAKECSQECNNNKNCTGFDLARQRNNKYDCYIFTIPKNNIIGQVSDRIAYGCFKKKASQIYPEEPEFSYNYNNKILDITFTNKNNITKYRITLSCSSAPDSYYILDMNQTKSDKTNIKIDIDNVLVNKIGILPQYIYLQIESIYEDVKSKPKNISFKYFNIPEPSIPIQEDESQRNRPRPSQKK